ncbi:MAG: ribonuclease III [Chloroflexi bacterium]|nr:ribonuclease III [Chloroflexota bacterium]
MPELDLAGLQRALRAKFHDPDLLRQALVHKSYVNERSELNLVSNERLEFLGDAVLGAVTAHLLYERYPAASEGDLTLLRAALVRQSTLAEWARKVDLGTYVLVGKGEARGGGRERSALLAQTFEAVIGAIYLDRGFACALRVLRRFLFEEPELKGEGKRVLDPKSYLQQLVQARFSVMPEYRVVEVRGPGHSPIFTVEVAAGPMRARGTGRTKQAAEQAAAQAGLEQLEALERAPVEPVG